MGLFSGKSARNLAIWQNQNAQEIQAKQAAELAAGRTAGLGAIDAAEPLSLAALTGGYGQARDQFTRAESYYDPFVQAGRTGLSGYMDAVGVNGPTGNTQAVANFRASPGYEYMRNQATDAVARQGSALGILGSGNTMAAISDRAGNMADQEWDDHLGQLRGLADMGMQATGAQAGIRQGLGGLYAQEGRDVSSIYGDNAARRAGIHTGTAALTSGTLGDLGRIQYQATDQAAQAGQKVKENIFGAVMGGLSLGSNLLGSWMGGAGGAGGAGGGGGFASLFGKR